MAKEEVLKKCRVIIKNPKLRKKDGTLEFWSNFQPYKIKENEIVEIPLCLYDQLKNHKKIETMPTGETEAVEMKEGFKRFVSSNFEIIDVV